MGAREDSPPKHWSRILPALVVVALVAASGCSALGAAPSAAGDLPSSEAAADRHASLDTISATVTVAQERNTASSTTVMRKRQRLDPWAYRVRVLSVNRSPDATPPLVSEGGFVVVNESTFTYYDPASDRFTRASIRGSNDSGESPYPRLVGAARTGESVDRPTATPGVPPLPQVPVETDADGNGSAAYQEGTVTVVYTGTETVAGRETYRLELTPTAPNMSLRSETLWLDAEYLYPLKRHTEFVADGDRYEYTRTLRNVTFNPTLEPGVFRVDADEVPGGVRDVQLSNYESAAAMDEAVELPVPDPEVPEGFELESATYRSADPEIATLRYERPDAGATIRVFVSGTETEVTSGTELQVGPYEARRSRTNGTTTITWVADGHTYHVSGDVDADTLVAVARSAAGTA